MGEMADDALDRWLDRIGYENEWDDEDNESGGADETPCKYCALPGLMWQETKKGWRLTDIHGIIHLCSERPMSKHAELLKASIQFPGFKK